jgi:hypothetical protein
MIIKKDFILLLLSSIRFFEDTASYRYIPVFTLLTLEIGNALDTVFAGYLAGRISG